MNTFPRTARVRHRRVGFAGLALVLVVAHLQSPLLYGAVPVEVNVKVVGSPGLSSADPLYTVNREPLLHSPFIKLPIGSITPKGWVRHQLELEAQGMTGHLDRKSVV